MSAAGNVSRQVNAMWAATLMAQLLRWGHSIISRVIQRVWFIAVCSVFMSCSERTQVADGYVFVTPPTMGPDHHPGTSLHLKGKVVWGNVYLGYFSGYKPRQFFHEGMVVFVGAVPANTDWWYYPQLFAVRGSGPPVLLSERLLGERFATSYDSRQYSSSFAVDNISPTADGVRVQFTHSPGTVNRDTNAFAVSWTIVRRFLDEADSSSRLVRHQLGDYRVLPLH
jgi:hypothetical protein